MWTLKNLIEHSNGCDTEINGKWVPCRPEPWDGVTGFIMRVKDGWKVITGKAEAFTWPEGQ